MKLFWQKAEVQKFEHAKDFAEEYNIGKNDFILASKSTYETYFAPLGLEAHVEFKSKYGKGEPTDVMIDALLADFRKTDCDRIIAIGGGAVSIWRRSWCLQEITPPKRSLEGRYRLKERRL